MVAERNRCRLFLPKGGSTVVGRDTLFVIRRQQDTLSPLLRPATHRTTGGPRDKKNACRKLMAHGGVIDALVGLPDVWPGYRMEQPTERVSFTVTAFPASISSMATRRCCLLIRDGSPGLSSIAPW